MRTETNAAQLFAYPPTTVTLVDNRKVLVRAASPRDAGALAAMHRRCSAESIHRRYLSSPRPTGRFLSSLLSTEVALVAVSASQAVIGLANLARDERSRAEVAVFVEDAWQDRGLGTAMLGQLITTAAQLGYGKVTMLSLPGEDWGDRALSRFGAVRVTPLPSGHLEVSLALAPHHVGSLGRLDLPRPRTT